MASSNPRPRHPIGSVDNVLRLLAMLQTNPEIRVAEAGDELRIARSTAHRLLAMLRYHGFVVQDPVTKAYRTGPTLLDLGLSAVRTVDIRSFARPYVERAAAAIDETVHLITREKTEILFVDGIESPRALRAGLRVGMRCPAHCTAAGKLLLSQLPEQEVRSLYRSSRLKPRTENSITTRAELEAELQRVREQGWAEAAGENEAEIAAVSVLVGDPTLGVQGALSYSVPLSRYDRSTRTKLVTELLEITGQDRPSTPDLRP